VTPTSTSRKIPEELVNAACEEGAEATVGDISPCIPSSDTGSDGVGVDIKNSGKDGSAIPDGTLVVGLHYREIGELRLPHTVGDGADASCLTVLDEGGAKGDRREYFRKYMRERRAAARLKKGDEV
jgi:hypothetical protein